MLTYTGPKAIMTAGGTHDSTQTYEALTVVFDSVSGNSYVSKIDVPTGISLDNTTYWQISANPNEAVAELLEDVADLQGDVSDLQTAVAGKIDADVVVDTAQDLADLTETGHLADALLVKDVYLRGADDIDYDNTSSGLIADDIQGAIDEVNGKTNTKVAKTQISNPNLIDNPWFTINQRGQSSYTTVGYTVDRWKGASQGGQQNMNIAVNDNGVIITNPNASQRLDYIQILETDLCNRLIGKQITISVLYADNSIEYKSAVVQGNPSQWDVVLDMSHDDYKIQLEWLSTTQMQVVIRVYSGVGNTVSIKAVKLEIGSISTLALDTAPNYAAELLKCQRYFVRLKTPYNYFSYAVGYVQAAKSIRMNLYLPTAMRTNPSLTKYGSFRFLYGNEQSDVLDNATFALNGMSNNILFAAFNSSSNYSASVGTAGQIQVNNDANAYIDFTADL